MEIELIKVEVIDLNETHKFTFESIINNKKYQTECIVCIIEYEDSDIDFLKSVSEEIEKQFENFKIKLKK